MVLAQDNMPWWKDCTAEDKQWMVSQSSGTTTACQPNRQNSECTLRQDKGVTLWAEPALACACKSRQLSVKTPLCTAHGTTEFIVSLSPSCQMLPSYWSDIWGHKHVAILEHLWLRRLPSHQSFLCFNPQRAATSSDIC